MSDYDGLFKELMTEVKEKNLQLTPVAPCMEGFHYGDLEGVGQLQKLP